MRNHLVPSARARPLPAGTINGELTLNGDSLTRQLDLANSAYVAAAENYHIYVGLKQVFADGERAAYYWFLNFYDTEAAKQGDNFWTASASKQDMYDFVVEKTKSLYPKYTEIVRRTNVEDMVTPPIKLKDLELDRIPEGRITLLGDAVSCQNLMFDSRPLLMQELT